MEETIRTGYDPVDDAVDLLISCEDSSIFLEYCKWVMDQDPKRGIKIFSHPERKSKLDKSEILEFLKNYGKFYQIEFMSYLIFIDGDTDENLHTQMGIFCIDLLQEANQNVQPSSSSSSSSTNKTGNRRRARLRTQLNNNDNQQLDANLLKSIENHLMKLLQFSEFYNTATLLGRIQGDSMLFDACVILYSRVC